MANKVTTDKVHGHVLEVTAPGDYGLKKDDGFDPSKYDFYNPSNRNAATTFVVHLDEFVLFPDCLAESRMLTELQRAFERRDYTLRSPTDVVGNIRDGQSTTIITH